MANVLAVVAFVLGVVVTASCLVVWVAVLVPGPVRRARDRLETAPLLCFVWGAFAVSVTFIAITLLFPQRDAGFRLLSDILAELSATLGLPRFSNDYRILTHITGWLALAPIMIWWVLGGAGLASLFANRMRPESHGPFRVGAIACGAVCTYFSYFLPFAGWFVFLPVVGCSSVGAGLLATVLRSTASRVPAGPAADVGGSSR